MNLPAVIVAGGAGERIRAVSRAMPKALLDVGGRPVIEHQIRLLQQYGVTKIHLTVRERDLPAFRERLGSGRALGITLEYHTESKPMGTAGGIRPLLDRIGDPFLVLYGDVMVNMDLEALAEFHRQHNAAATLVVHPSDHPQDSDLVELDADGRIRAFHRKPHPPAPQWRNLGNAALYVVSHRAAAHIPDGVCDFMREVFPAAQAAGLPLFGYRTREYLKDIGTPARLAAVRHDWQAGRIARRHREHALPAVFFDRDGTLCEHVPFLHRVEDMRLLAGAAEAVRKVNQSDALAVVVTNQPVVAQGLCTYEQLEHIHGRMEMLLAEHGATLDGIYYCPHHPRRGYPGEVAALKIECECRKPGGALLVQAARELNIDLAHSVLIGDTTRDVETGRRLGLPTALVLTGQGGRDGKFSARPDSVCADVGEAVKWALERIR
ncbi:MAG: HAD-IIIA family hydrolase [Candidatus Sumerlaeia bacterium]|nr:HAD-IIIA family hydrolase [Candidatus Sumerlaeia bacterium]